MKIVGGILGILVVLGLAIGGMALLRQSIAEGTSLVWPYLALALPLLLAGALIVAGAAALSRPLKRHDRVQAGLAVGLAAVLGVGAYALVGDVPVQRPDAAVTAAVAKACQGLPVPEAGALHTDGTIANHLVVLDTTGAEHDWTGKPPVGWRPATLDDVEVVACVETKDTVAVEQVCHYNGPDTTRYSATRQVRVVAARTGIELARFSITEDADSCPVVKVADQARELMASVDWPIVQRHLASFVQNGTFVDPDAEATIEEPGSSGPEPGSSAEPGSSGPEIRTRGLTLQAALADGSVTARGIGDTLEQLDLRLTSHSPDQLRVRVDAGTYLDPGKSATQTMIVITSTVVMVPPFETVTETLAVACAQMHDDQPGSSDSFKVRAAVATGALRKLLASDRFAAADFRIKQFAIWTITSNPTRSGYVGLGMLGVGSGPSATELRQIKAIFKAAGIDASKYRALR